MTNPLSFDDLQGILHRHIDQLPDNRQGQNNAYTLLGMEQIPCDDQVRNLFDPLAPSAIMSVRGIGARLTPIFGWSA